MYQSETDRGRFKMGESSFWAQIVLGMTSVLVRCVPVGIANPSSNQEKIKFGQIRSLKSDDVFLE